MGRETEESQRSGLNENAAESGVQMKNGKEMVRIGVKAIGPMKVRQRDNPKAGMNGKKMMSMDTFQGKGKKGKEGKKGKKGKGRKRKAKGRKGRKKKEGRKGK